MDQQLKELCIKCEPDSNLAVCLGKYTKQRLKQILDTYGVKLPSAAKKQEMAEKTEEVVKENIISYFNGDGADKKADMQAVISRGMMLKDSGDIADISDFLDRGLIYLREVGDAAEVVVPVNVKAIMELVDEKPAARYDESRQAQEPSGDRSEQDEEVIMYAASLANIYGTYPAKQVKEIWDFNHRHGIAPDDLRSALRKAGDSDGFYIYESDVVNVRLPETEDYIRTRGSIRSSDIYYYPSEDVIKQYADGPVYDEEPEYYYLRNYIARKAGGGEKADEIMADFFLICACDPEDEELTAFAASKGIEFEDDSDRRRFMYLTTCWIYSIRLWSCKGYKPSELRTERLAYRNFVRGDLDSPKKIRLTGRNDECPCGSGKKFKKCCMRYAQ